MREEGFPGSCPLAFFAVRLCTVAVVSSLPTCAHWRVRSFSPLSPGGKGTLEGEQREEAGAPMPRGALPQWRSGCAGPAHPATLSLLLSALFRAPPGRRGCKPTLLRGRPGAAPQLESRDPPSHSPQQQEPSNSAATKGHISAPPGGRRRRCLEQPPPPLPARDPTSKYSRRDRHGRPGTRTRVHPSRARSHALRGAHAHSAPLGRLCSLT